MIHRPEQDARLAADAGRASASGATSAGATGARSTGRPSIVAGEALAERRVRDLGREVDLRRRVERRVDLPAVEERVQQPRAAPPARSSRTRSCGRARRARPGGRSGGAAAARGSRSRPASRSRASPPISSVSTFESRTRRTRSRPAFAGQASISPPPRAEELRPGVAEDRVAAVRRPSRSSASRRACRPGRRRPARPRRTTRGTPSCATSDMNQNPLGVALRGREPGVQRHRRGQRRRVGRRLHQAVERRDARGVPSSNGRPQNRSGMCGAVFRIDAARSSVRSLHDGSCAHSRE